MTARAAVGARRTDPVAAIERARRHPDAARRLVGLLAEGSPLYAGRGANDAERLRGYVLASFETVGLPEEAVAYVLEELETGRHPYAVAGAARALRGASPVPSEAPGLLVAAIARLRASDDAVSFERFAPGADASSTALGELASTLARLGPDASEALPALRKVVADGEGRFAPRVRAALREAIEALAPTQTTASCCCGPAPVARLAPQPVAEAAVPPELASLGLENQDGERLTFAEAFSGRPAAVAFFYTRCTNPEKCSLTVTRLGRLARRVAEEELDATVAGVSYDPRWDNPGRLRRYGADRGVEFSPRCSLLRTVGPFEPLVAAFELGVGFGPVTVNRHRLDVVVLDDELRVVERLERRLWSEETVLEALRRASVDPMTSH